MPRERSARAADIERAVEVLRAGGLVGFPTETVYGLGADATNPAAVRRIFEVKGRPSWHPLIVHIGDAALLDTWARDVPQSARRLAGACWPGPLTVILRRSWTVPDEVTGGVDTVGLRVPSNPVALAMLRAFGGGIAAPSANRFGRVSPTTAEHVRAELGATVDLVLDGGPCEVGVESTIVDLSGGDDAAPTILRPGSVTAEVVEGLVGRSVTSGPGPGRLTTPAPGTLDAHYAPSARVELVDEASTPERARALVAAGRRVGVLAPVAISGLPVEAVQLVPAGEPDTFARRLYGSLRDADAAGVEVLLVVPPPATGIGAAVVDRLRRAAR